MPGWVVGIIDVALWDLMGKETGLSVYRLLGGAARTTIPLYWSTGSGWGMEPTEMLDRVKAGWDLGFRAFKIRMDWRGWRQDINPDKDFEMFRLVRAFPAPETYLAFDANNGYSVSTAIQQGRRFEALGINEFEEPIPNHDRIGLKPVMPHSPHAGINSMASLHVYSTVENATRPHEFSAEFSGPLDDIAELYGEHVLPKHGIMELTERPGFGIELNEAAVSRG